MIKKIFVDSGSPHANLKSLLLGIPGVTQGDAEDKVVLLGKEFTVGSSGYYIATFDAMRFYVDRGEYTVCYGEDYVMLPIGEGSSSKAFVVLKNGDILNIYDGGHIRIVEVSGALNAFSIPNQGILNSKMYYTVTNEMHMARVPFMRIGNSVDAAKVPVLLDANGHEHLRIFYGTHTLKMGDIFSVGSNEWIVIAVGPGGFLGFRRV